MEIEWDPRKAVANVRKHGVDFVEAMTVFEDPLELTIPDPRHSRGDERFVSVGRSALHRLLVVVYSEGDGRIRIISAREATPKERREYEAPQPPE